jgi:glycosyltransferase involved in cell wall biosynthesis
MSQPINSHPTNQPRKALRICMLSYSFYDGDARVSRYAETLARRGDHVDVVSLGKDGQDEFTTINGVNVFRIQKRERNEKGRFQYLFRLSKFFAKSSIFLSKRHRKAPYDVIHVHSVPDFEVFAAWLPKLTGAGVILDIHDIVPEFYAAKFKVSKDSLVYKILILIERLSGGFADRVIISNHIWEKTLSRSVKNGKCLVVMNYPDPNVFYRRPKTREDKAFVVAYPGSLNWHQGLDIAIRAFVHLNEEVPEAQLHIYGEGNAKNALRELAEDLGIKESVFVYDPVPKERLAEIMSQVDLGVVPKRNDSFGGEAFSTKILEFMSLGVPVVVSRTRIDQYYFNDSVVKFFEPENISSLSSAMVEMASDERRRKELSERGRELVAREYDWEVKKDIYLDMVDQLATKRLSDWRGKFLR